jgi:hypothetical protein
MATDGSPIDISILEALIELRKQQAQVDQFCQRAEERKDKVEAAVFSRVMADYGKRRADLEAEAAPLVTKALIEYRKLRASFEAVRATQAAARLDKEEIEFRHALGEVDDAVQTDRLKEPERLIAETTEQLLGRRRRRRSRRPPRPRHLHPRPPPRAAAPRRHQAPSGPRPARRRPSAARPRPRPPRRLNRPRPSPRIRPRAGPSKSRPCGRRWKRRSSSPTPT